MLELVRKKAQRTRSFGSMAISHISAGKHTLQLLSGLCFGSSRFDACVDCFCSTQVCKALTLTPHYHVAQEIKCRHYAQITEQRVDHGSE
eukprot:1009209-Amphidinium_carterae.1